MNTMVGMQATSLHTPPEDSFSELMKSDTNLDTTGVMMGAVGPVAVNCDASDDYFDPDDLLLSPLFNDSNPRIETDEESFGNFGSNSSPNGNGVGSCAVPMSSNGVLSTTTNRNNIMMDAEPKREFVPMGLRRSDNAGFPPVKHAHSMMTPNNQSLYGGGMSNMNGNININVNNNMSNSMDNNMSNNGDLFGDLGMAFMQQQQQQQQQQQNFQSCGMDNVASFHSAMDNSGSSSHNNYSSHNNNKNNHNNGGQFSSYLGGNQQMGDDSSQAEFAHDDCSVTMVNPYLMSNNSNMCNNNNKNVGNSSSSAASFYRTTPDLSNSSASSSYGSEITPARGPAMLDLTQDNDPMCRRAPPQRSQTYHPGGESNYSNMCAPQMQQQFQLQQMQEQQDCGQNRLEMMQNNMLQMPDLQLMQQQLLEQEQQQQQQQQQQQGSLNNSGNGFTGMSQSMHLPSRSASCGQVGPHRSRGTRGMRGGRVMMGANDLEAMQVELGRSGMMAANGNGMMTANGNGTMAVNGNGMMAANGNGMMAANGNPMMAASGNPMMAANGNPMMAANGNAMIAANGNAMIAANGNPMMTANDLEAMQAELGRPGMMGGANGNGGMMGANDLEAMQTELGRSRMMGGGGATGNGGPVTVNDAMEKLCESMKRSAMSRTLVKQFSGRGGVARTPSGSGMVMAMARSNSSRQSGMMDDSSSRSAENRPAVPVRRISNTKHHLQSRGVYRHGSGHLGNMSGHAHGNNTHLGSMSGHAHGNNTHNGAAGNLSFQIDGRNMGSL